MDVLSAPVRVKRRLNIAVLADFGEHFGKEAASLFLLERSCRIEFIELFETKKLFFHNALVFRVVKLSAVKLIFGIFVYSYFLQKTGSKPSALTPCVAFNVLFDSVKEQIAVEVIVEPGVCVLFGALGFFAFGFVLFL